MRYSYLQATDGDGRLVMPGVETERVFLVNVLEGVTVRRDRRELPELIWQTHQNEGGERPLAQTIRSMCVGDVIVLHDGPSESGLDERALVLVVDTFGFARASEDLAREAIRLARRGVPAHGTVPGSSYYAAFAQGKVAEEVGS